MQLSNLPKLTQKTKKRVGRGHGSGRGGHTSGRGAKGQKSRSKVGLFFEGTKFKKSFLKRLPLLRGKGKLRSKKKTLVINLKYLNVFSNGEEVNAVTLKEKGIVDKKLTTAVPLKILGEGELKVSVMVNLPCSKNAREKIEKAGGKIIYGQQSATRVKPAKTKSAVKEKKQAKQAKQAKETRKKSEGGK